MVESDKALCTRISEWGGWKWQRDIEGHTNHLVRPEHLSICRKDGRNPDWPDKYFGPSWDTDPVAALELLAWLVGKGWRAIIHISKGYSYVDLIHEMWEISDVTVQGPPPTALPKAIALTVEKVIEAESEEGHVL